MTFDTNDFWALPTGAAEWEADLPAILDYYQNKYFPDAPPITWVGFVHSLPSPGAAFPEVHRIEVSERLCAFPKLCCFMVLHELANNKLFHEHGRVVPYDSAEHRAEVKRLWEAGAYEGIL